jgi:hypothetical protein
VPTTGSIANFHLGTHQQSSKELFLGQLDPLRHEAKHMPVSKRKQQKKYAIKII